MQNLVELSLCFMNLVKWLAALHILNGISIDMQIVGRLRKCNIPELSLQQQTDFN